MRQHYAQACRILVEAHMPNRFRRAFTLVELLVLVAIVAVLLALLLPSLKRAQEHARRAACLSNLSQIGRAIMMYVNDYKGRFPREAFWTPQVGMENCVLAPYGLVEEVYRCPSEDRPPYRPSLYSYGPPNYDHYQYSYTGNWLVFASGPQHRGICINQVVRSSQKIMVIDESEQTIDDPVWATTNWFIDRQNMLSNRHDLAQERARESDAEETLKRGRGNVLFVDAHADFIPRRWAMDPDFYDPLKP
jgi:prepilin-type processing-associated H-X9-DG protein